ncbi:glycosyltransferase [Nanoarchaeota archaeon]
MIKVTLLAISVFLLGIPFFVYLSYIFGILLIKRKKIPLSDSAERISIVIPTRNEEKVIQHRIHNIANLNYPKKNIQVIIVDDDSEDNTIKLAKTAFKKFKIKSKIIKNKKRMGTNFSYNRGVKAANTEYIVTTDADVVFEKNSLLYLLSVLKEKRVGAVCGELKAVINKKTLSTSTEKPYRNMYGKMCTLENELGSCFCFNGPLIMLKKSAFKEIPITTGASDASAALSIIKKGYKTYYVQEAKFSELITPNIKSQRRQKVRRATRLLEAMWNNKTLIFNGTAFGSFVFPLRFLMLFITPTALIIGTILFTITLYLQNPLFGLSLAFILLLIFLSGKIKSNFLASWLWHNIFLLEGLLKIYRNNFLWTSIERKKV